jgi:putative two-component system response regulator
MPKIQRKPEGIGVPPEALLLSLLSLWVPILSSSIFPEWTNGDVGILVWLLSLIPPFLLSYYRGWQGASLALAGGMAAFALAQVAVTLVGAPTPAPGSMLGIAVVLIIVSLGSGALSSIFHRSLDRAERMALTDEGTGLPNRRHGMLHLTRAFAAANRGALLSVVMFDLDKFKSINDRFGHRTGDHVLDVFSQILEKHTRAMHLSVRFGGEEFLAILDGVEAEGAAVMANRVLDDLRGREFPWGRVTVSAGISEYEEGMASPDILVAAADQALYRAKGRGGDVVVTLARQGSTPSASAPEDGEAKPGRTGSGELVLIVDDDPAVLKTLSRALVRRHYHPLEASDPLQALQLMRGLKEPVDLVITDVVMPEMSGFRLVEMLMDIQPQLRALYISGYSSDEVRWSGVPGVVKGFLPKPISLDGLTTAVRGILDAEMPEPADPEASAEPRVATAELDEYDLRDRLHASSARLDEAYGELLVRLARAAEYRDDVTGRHAERVARLSGLIAREMGLADEDAGRIEQAALLHDVGKIAIPDALLRKPDGLTRSEEEITHRHCIIGADLLAGSRHPLVQEAERVARSHHERWDGRGYPDGLAGSEIPVSARIVAVADAVDDMTVDRPNRRGASLEDALRTVKADRGRQFDPDVVDSLMRLDRAGSLRSLEDVQGAGERRGGPPTDATARERTHLPRHGGPPTAARVS